MSSPPHPAAPSIFMPEPLQGCAARPRLLLPGCGDKTPTEDAAASAAGHRSRSRSTPHSGLMVGLGCCTPGRCFARAPAPSTRSSRSEWQFAGWNENMPNAVDLTLRFSLPKAPAKQNSLGLPGWNAPHGAEAAPHLHCSQELLVGSPASVGR